MNKYNFVARSPTGRKYKGSINAENEQQLNDIMIEHNYQLIHFKIKKEKEDFLSFNKIGIKEVLNLTEKILMLIKSGIILSEAISLAADSFSNAKFRNILHEIVKEMNKGKSFSIAMLDYPKIFTEFYRTMIGVAEVSGKLVETLEYLITYYNYDQKIKKKIRSSMFYPCLLVVLSIVVLVVVSIVVIPNFTQIFSQMHIELPLITRIIIGISTFISKYYFYIFIGILFLAIAIVAYFQTNKGKYYKDLIKLKLPFVKTVVTCNLATRFCKSLTMLVESGLPTVIALQTVSELIGNKFVREKFRFAIDEVKRGEGIAESLMTMNVFPDLLLQTLIISEKTASLSYSLRILGEIYEEDAQNKLQKVSSMIEPIFILLISGFVVLLIVAIFIPLFSMLDSITNF